MDGASGDAHVYCSRLDKDVGVVIVVAVDAIVDDEERVVCAMGL
jgi:hypothetical protein